MQPTASSMSLIAARCLGTSSGETESLNARSEYSSVTVRSRVVGLKRTRNAGVLRAHASSESIDAPAGKRNVTADTALRLSRYFGMSADFWMNLQSTYELDLARKQNGKLIQRLPQRDDTPIAV